MAPDFDQWVDRRHSNSLKWDKYADRDIIPLWVADMDFRSPDCVIEALQQRVTQGVFGYGGTHRAITELLITRMAQRYNWQIKPEWLVFLPGVVSGLHLSVRAATQSDEKVIIPHSVYPPFYHAGKAASRETLTAPVCSTDGRWKVDFEAIEHNLSGQEKLLMLCNPHNPGGTVYQREELLSQLAFAQRHNLVICSDEIHCDIILQPGQQHLPIASLNDDAEQRTITLLSPSKTFNIAGLGASVAIIANAELRKKFQQVRTGITPDANILAWVAAEAAWRDGQPWLDALLPYLRSSAALLEARINTLPGVSMISPAATYLAWIDVSGLQLDDPIRYFEAHGLGFSAGADFGDSRFIRFNFATNKAQLEQAMVRFEAAVLQQYATLS